MVSLHEVGEKNFGDNFTRLDIDTNLEDFLKLGVGLTIFIAVVLRIPPVQFYLQIDQEGFFSVFLAGISVFLASILVFTDCTYFLDNKGKGGRRRYYNEAKIVLELKNTIRFEVTKKHTDLDMVTSYGRVLSQHLGCDFLYPQNETSSLSPNEEEIAKVECTLKWATWSQLISADSSKIITLIVAIATFIGIGGVAR